MIWTLFREQWRAHRAATVVAAVLAATATAFATYAVSQAAFVAQSGNYALTMQAGQGTHGAVRVLSGLGAEPPQGDGYAVAITADELEALLSSSSARRSEAWATTCMHGDTLPASLPTDPQGGSNTQLCAVWGNPAWSTLIAAGRPPGPGEVALAASSARSLGVDIGDTVDLWSMGSRSEGRWSGRVSGLVFDAPPGTWQWPVGAYVAGSDPAVQHGLLDPSSDLGVQVDITWSGEVAPQGISPDWQVQGQGVRLDLGTTWPIVVAFSLAFGTLIASAAGARHLRAARVTLTATLQALGARRRHLVGAVVIEAALVWAVALTGAGAGAVASAIQRQAWRASVAAPAPVESGVGLWLLMFAVVLAATFGVVTCVPAALQALRVSPASALRPASALPAPAPSTSVARRRGVIWAAGAVFVASASGFFLSLSRTRSWALLFGATAAILAVIIAWVGLSHSARRWGEKWSTAAKPWKVLAGVILRSQPEMAGAQAMIPLVLVASAVEVNTYWAGQGAAFGWFAYTPWQGSRSWPLSADGQSALWAAIAVALMTNLALTMAATRRSHQGAGAAAAFGALPRDVRRANVVVSLAPQLLGAVAGVFLGVALGWAALTASAVTVTFEPNGVVAAPLLALTAFCPAAAILTAVVTLSPRPTRPPHERAAS